MLSIRRQSKGLHFHTLATQPIRGSSKASSTSDHTAVGPNGVVTVLTSMASVSTQSTLINICNEVSQSIKVKKTNLTTCCEMGIRKAMKRKNADFF